MFQETRELPATEIKTTKYHELAEVMRRGTQLVTPDHGSYGDENPDFGCAICCLARALSLEVGAENIGVYGKVREELYRRYDKKIVDEIEARFEGWKDFERHSFEQVVDWLETIGS